MRESISVAQLESEPAVEISGPEPEDVPFPIPEKWKWCLLGDVIDYGSCSQVAGSSIDKNTWVLDLEDIEKGTGRVITKKRGVSTSSNKSIFEKGWVLYSKLRPYLNKVVVADEDGVCTTEIVPINVGEAKFPIHASYLKIYLMAPYFLSYANSVSRGVKMPRLGTKEARKALIAVPPLEEQKRIVQKVNFLLAEIQQTEKVYAELTGPLTDHLRALLLDKAIRGELVPQLETEPAIDISGDKPEDVPFIIPKKWKWYYFRDLIDVISGTSYRKSDITFQQNGIRIIRGGNINNFIVSFYPDDVFVDQELRDESKVIQSNDIVIVASTGSKEVIGKPAICKDSQGAQIGAFLRILRPKYPELSRFIQIVVQTKYFREKVREEAKGTSINNIKRSTLDNLTIPVPPIEEQNRIVEQLELLTNSLERIK